MRQSVYRVLKTVRVPVESVRSRVRVAFVDRCPSSRCIVNHADVVQSLLSSAVGSEIDFTWPLGLGLEGPVNGNGSLHMEELSFAEQVALMRNADVFVGVHGSGLVNSVFMEAGGVLMELRPPGVVEWMFSAAAISSGQQYIPVDVENVVECLKPIPPECAQDRKNYQANLRKPQCGQAPKHCKLVLDADGVDVLMRALTQAVQWVHMRKRGRSASGPYDG